MVIKMELNDINKEEYNQNLQKKKAYYYKKSGSKVVHWYRNMCPLEIITHNEKHKGFYLEIQDQETYIVWIEIEGVIFKYCSLGRWTTLEELNEKLVYMGKDAFLKKLEFNEKKHIYINLLCVEVVKALGYGDLSEHYAEYMYSIKQEWEDNHKRKALEEELRLKEKEKRQQEELDKQILEAENKILNKSKVHNVEMNNGNSILLELFKANGIKLPLRTQGWVNDTLAEVSFKFDGSITYSYFSRGNNSKVFFDYLLRLEEKIREKHNGCLAAAE